MKLPPWPEMRKAAVAVLTAFVIVANTLLGQQGIIPEDWVPWVTAFVAVAGALGVYQVPNRRPTGRHVAGS